MDVNRTKTAITLAILALATLLTPAMGLTASSTDSKQGVMIDFGYYDVVWVEMAFTEGMDGNGALDAACHIKGYPVVRDGPDVYSVNGQDNLVGSEWGFHVLTGTSWVRSDPATTDVSACKIVCWARTGPSSSMMPGTDAGGHTYYGYATDGISARTGKPLRVVTLAPSATETVSAVGGTGYIVGTDVYSDCPREIAEGKASGRIAKVGGYIDPNYEWIVRTAPDLVFCDESVGEHVNVADRLRKSGIDCVILRDCIDIDTMYENIWIVASAMGMSENANGVIADLRESVKAVRGIAGDTGRRVFVSLSADPSPWTCGSATFMDDLIGSAGGTNVFRAQASSWFMASKEQIYAKQPEVIVIITERPVDTEEKYAELVGRIDPVWRETPAYRNGDVYVFSSDAGDILSRPGPRLSEAAELLAKILNPQEFLLRDSQDVVPKYLSDDYREYLKYQRRAFA